MPIYFACPCCGANYMIPDHLADAVMQCKYCGTVVENSSVRTSKPFSQVDLPPGNPWIVGGVVILMLLLAVGAWIVYSRFQIPTNQSVTKIAPNDESNQRPPEIVTKEAAPTDVSQNKGRVLPIDSWEVGSGKVREEGNALIIDNDGARYWLVSKERLPEDFTLVVKCSVELLKGKQKDQPSLRRSLRVQFGGDTSQKDEDVDGAYFHFSHTLLQLCRNGKDVQTTHIGIPANRFELTLIKEGSNYTFQVDGHDRMKYVDDRPLAGKHRFSIGGYLSRLRLEEVSIKESSK